MQKEKSLGDEESEPVSSPSLETSPKHVEEQMDEVSPYTSSIVFRYTYRLYVEWIKCTLKVTKI